jgi:hypothetical protein
MELFSTQDESENAKMNTIHTFFDKIFCINLERRVDRLDHVLTEFAKHSLQVEIVPAVDGNLIEAGAISAARLGCLRSHRMVLENCVRLGLDRVLIFEDDILLVDDFGQRFSRWCVEIPNDWEMLYVGWLNWLPIRYDPVSANLGRVYDVGTAHALGLRGGILNKLIEIISLEQLPLDFYYMGFQHDHRAYAFRKSLADQARGKLGSDINDR